MPFSSDKTRQGAAGVSTGFEIPYSCRFDKAKETYLSKTFGSGGDRRKFSYSLWLKLGSEPNAGPYVQTLLGSSTRSDAITINSGQDTGNGEAYYQDSGCSIKTASIYQDSSAWYHFLWVWDSDNAAAGNRMRVYINGVEATHFITDDNPALNTDSVLNQAELHTIGKVTDAARHLNGYLAEVHFVDGYALTPSSFGESGDYGEWKPIKVSGLTYGDTGFYLDFADAADLGNDVSGEGNDFAENNITAADQMLDTPTNNFATMNPLDRSIDNSTVLTEGNLKCVQDYVSDSRTVRATMGNSTGKWYFECLIVAGGDGVWSHGDIGILNVQDDIDRNNVHLYDTGWWHGNSGQTFNGSSAENTSLSAVGNGDIVQVAYDLDASKIWFGRNNTWILSGNPATAANPTYSNLSGTLAPACDMMESNSNGTLVFNFGQDSSFAGVKTAAGNQDDNSIGDFYYDVPAGFMALCTSNLPDVAVTPSEHFDVALYTGNGSTQDITSLGFQPDFTWIKNRSAADHHQLFDAVRGVTKTVPTSATTAEVANDDTLTHFLSNGFTTGDDVVTNTNTENYVSWNWKLGGSGGTSHTQGTRDTTVSANQDAGQSLMYWTGAGSGPYTLGHGLSKAPEVWVYRNINDNGSWNMYHHKTSSPFAKTLYLNDTAAETTSVTASAISSTLVTVPDGGATDAPNRLLAYAFHSVDGYSKFGSYEGNGNVDGTFVHLGFRPRYFMTKVIDDTDAWSIFDSERGRKQDAANLSFVLYANNDPAEGELAGGAIEFLSNGVKIRNAANIVNQNNITYIYLAFAEQPFKYSNAK